MKPGVYQNLSNEEYHGHKESISRSALMDFDRNPYTYWANHLNPNRPMKEPTPQMILGTAVHTFILEPEKFNVEYIKEPAKVLLKNVGKEKYEEYKKQLLCLEHENKIILSHEEWDTVLNIFRVLEKNHSALELISNARIENSFFWEDKDSGLLVKARPDILHSNMIVDLKTCFDASPRAFQNAMVGGGYHIQGAMIRDGVEQIEGHRINNVINICIETKYPYNMGIYIIDEFALDEGEAKYKKLLLELKEAKEANSFNDFGIQTIGLPRWAI